MSRLALDVDPVAYIRNIFESKLPDPATVAVLAELGGVESLVGYLRDDFKTINERDVYILKEISKTHLNIRINMNEKLMKNLLKIQPDMITFVAPGSVNSIKPQPLQIDTYLDNLREYVADLRANGIASSILIEPEVSNIKAAGKIEFDYVELYCEDFATADDLDQEIAELEKLNSIAIAANKIGMGVNISGFIDSENIRELIRIKYLDDIIIDYALIDKALSIGVEQAVRDFISIF